MPAFLDIHVEPSYGKKAALISWTVESQYAYKPCYIYRSYNEVDWELLNMQGITSGEWLDEEFYIGNKLQRPFYRLFMDLGNGEGQDSPIITPFDVLSPKEYGLVSSILRREHLRMSRGNGVRVFHYKPLTSGTPNPAYDPLTGQEVLATCEDDDSYGLPFVGGYGTPIQTWAEFLNIGPVTESDVETGEGKRDSYDIRRARLLSWPKPRTGDLIIHPNGDDRYVIGEQIQPYRFRGIVPIAYDTMLILLRRDDPRYRVPVPAMRNTPHPPTSVRPQAKENTMI